MKHLCSSKARWINQEVISQPVLVVQKVLKNFKKNFMWAKKFLLQSEVNAACKKLLVVLRCSYNPTRLCTSIPDTGTHTPGMTLPRRAWVRLNCVRIVVGRFRSCLFKRGMASSAACECGAEQTVDHVVLHFRIHRPPTDYTAWRFWTMRQPNGCSTPAPISRRASSG